MLLSKHVPKKGIANTEFCSQYLAYKQLPTNIKNKLKKIKATYSSEGPISITKRKSERKRKKN